MNVLNKREIRKVKDDRLECVIRYFAFDNHGIVFENENDRGELLYYYNEYKNDYWKNQPGYVSVSISSWQVGKYYLESYVQVNDRLRKQIHGNSEGIYNNYEEAKEKALQDIEYLESKMNGNWWLEQPIIQLTQSQIEDITDGNKEVKPDGTLVVRICGDSNYKKYKYSIDDLACNTEIYRVTVVQKHFTKHKK